MVAIPENHPYWHVRSVVELERVRAVAMSYYRYQPQTVSESRLLLEISREDFLNPNKILEIFSRVPEGHELAIHSNMIANDFEECHLAMIDMSTGAKAHLEKLREFLGDNFFQELAWFSSGRSFHGYGSGLLSKDHWIQLMGLLLLANKPRMEPTVDPRWIGHRLLGGYSALRWTKNTSYYLIRPFRLDSQRKKVNQGIEIGPVGKSFRTKL